MNRMPEVPMTRMFLHASVLLISLLAASNSSAADVERQPLEAMVRRVTDALTLVGSPLSAEEDAQLKALYESTDDAAAIKGIQELLDRKCLVVVGINPESRVKVERGAGAAVLDELGWTNVLVKVVNEAGVTAPLTCECPQAEPMVLRSTSSALPEIKISPAESNRRWLDLRPYNLQPLPNKLSGLQVEYRLFQLYSRDSGKREATLGFNVGQGTQDLGFRSEIAVLFDCRPSAKISIQVLDFDGTPTTCSLLIKDKLGRVYPNPSRRLAPDFFFHEQIYRANGEHVHLAHGSYTITATRGPEYLPVTFDYEVKGTGSEPIEIKLNRWIHMSDHQWYSGDHHVHAAGCAHYENPTQGVTPDDMMRHVVGEDLNIGCVLSWGPCWYHQKEYFDGKVSKLSIPGNLMRYDVEVSGFPSSHAGHLCLLNLKEDDYPGTEKIEQWPSWTLPVLKWGKEQGGIVGYSHSGWGLALPDYLPDGSRGALPATWGGANSKSKGRAADKLPDYAMPPFDGIGANEYIVSATQGLCDFISAVDTPSIWELNIWYHMLNCGFTTRISGETDFPCIYGDKVGLGRSYVHLPQADGAAKLTYEDWINGLRDGRSYVCDGLSHLLSMKLDDADLGQPGPDGRASVLKVSEPKKSVLRCTVAAYLPEQADELGKSIREKRLDQKPYWHLERARIETSRSVPVELIVNGQAVASKAIVADGQPRDLEFDVDLKQSSWIAIRILPSLHSNPIFVEVAGKPIRASRKSAQWCLDAVDVCWEQKRSQIKHEEMDAAKQAYDKAKDIYRRILSESVTD